MTLTVLQIAGYGSSTCGYCSPSGRRSETKSSYSIGMVAQQMSSQYYQELIDRGWRRSGNYVYHPDMGRTCCPQYTIRLDVNAFKTTRQQRGAVNKWNRFLAGQEEDTGKGKKQRAKPFELEEELTRYLSRDGETKGKHMFQLELVPAKVTPQTYELYKRYQIAVHKDPPSKVSKSGYERFLCSDVLGRQPIPYTNRKRGELGLLPVDYGAYHLLFRVDGKLVALSVIDILPACVSSVYFIWDPDWAWASLGKLSALFELQLVRDLAAAGAPGMEWLYMGYWIANCQKMRYKGEYSPSFLLDPGTQRFHRLTPKLDRYLQIHRGYTPFERIEGMEETVVNEEYAAAKDGKSMDDVAVTEPRPPGMDMDSDDDESEDDEDDAVFPSPPPPGAADPDTLPKRVMDSLLVLTAEGGRPGIVPYSAYQRLLSGTGRKYVKELVASLGLDMMARKDEGDWKTRGFLCFD